jgi:hypothetical protein
MASLPVPAPQDAPAGGGAMSDDELAALLAEHETRAIGYFESEIASEQADALDRYYRRPYGDERAGRSKVVDATVAITVDNALAAILKPFVSSDETVVFEPRSSEDEEQAQQATEYVNYVLHHDNCGFLVLHDWFKDALLAKLGVVKVYWEDYTREKVHRLENLDPLQIEELAQDIEAVYGPDENGLFIADVRRVEPDGKLCIENVPPEEYRISPLARPGRVPPYEAHITRKAKSELVEMGFDPKVVEHLSKADSNLEDSRSRARYEDEQWGVQGEQPPGDESRQLVQLNDEYVLIDYDGDGVSELRHIIRSGNVVLLNEECDKGPFAKLCPAPMPHKIYGLSLADQVKDEQRIKTVITRQTLDNLYLANNPRPVVTSNAERDDGSTIEDLLSDAPGAIIRAGIDPIIPFAVPFVGDKSFPMLEYIDGQTEARSGVAKHGQGMDPDALDTAGQITATQAAIMQDGRNSRAEMIARIFAETGIKDLFKLMLKLLVEHQPRARMIRLRNKWVEMDPRSWNAEMDVAISVGLGTGNRAEQMAMAEGVLQLMERIGQTPFGAMIDSEKVYNGVKKFLNAAGIKNIDDFVNEPPRDEEGNIVEPEAPPSPEEQKMQAEMQMKAAELQAKQAEGQMKIQLAREEAAAKIELEREKAQAEMVMNQQRMEQELVLERERMMLQHQVAMEQARQREAFAARDADRRDAETSSKIKKNRSGGDLDK